MARILYFLLLLTNTTIFAKTFKTQFIRIELPPNWDCKQEERDWVCQPDNLAERNEVIMVVVVKEVDPVDDNFGKYENILATPKDMRDLLGNAYKSSVKYTKRNQIQGQTWVDSLHFGSEIPGFFTRYIASIDQKIAALVTYSVAESVYAKWAEILDRAINSMKLEFDPKAFAEIKDKGGDTLLGRRNTSRRLPPSVEEAQKEVAEEEADNSIIGIIIIVAALAYLIYRRKRNNKLKP